MTQNASNKRSLRPCVHLLFWTSRLWCLTCRKTWLLPILAPLLPHALARLSGDWGRVVASSGAQAATAAANGAHTSEAASAAESEVIAERLLRELTAEYSTLLTSLEDEGTRAVTGGYIASHVFIMKAD